MITNRNDFAILEGKTIKRIIYSFDDYEHPKGGIFDPYSTLLGIEFTDKTVLTFVHQTSCCEEVYLDDKGDLDDIVGETILKFSETISSCDKENCEKEFICTSCTWSFYDINTLKNHVQLKFFGESNGCYSETVKVEYGAYHLNPDSTY